MIISDWMNCRYDKPAHDGWYQVRFHPTSPSIYWRLFRDGRWFAPASGSDTASAPVSAVRCRKRFRSVIGTGSFMAAQWRGVADA